MSDKDQKDKNEHDPNGVGTTGHSWDGIEEYNNPLPKWWLYTFYATIIWGLIWMLLYPSWPLLNRAWPGLLGYSSRGDVVEDIAQVNAQNSELEAKLMSTEFTAFEDDANADVKNFALQGGAAVFRTNCAQCHGAGAQGAAGYPNLLDDDWLWGGTVEDIQQTVLFGIRDEAHDETRLNDMAAYVEIFSSEEIDAVTNYVLSLSGEPEHAEVVTAGAEIFAENCVSCHGEDAKGIYEMGAPNLTDAIWLYGGDYETVRWTIEYGRMGVMPHWQGRLTDAQIKQVSYYVHALGGGQ